jgi:hypothetical protein
MSGKKPVSSGTLAESIRIAMDQFHQQQAAGASLDEARENLARTVRAAWPRRRIEPWHYICDTCQDTGWREQDCPARDCGRRRPHAAHFFVRPCVCARGLAVRATIEKPTPADIGDAGAGRKRLTRLGHR